MWEWLEIEVPNPVVWAVLGVCSIAWVILVVKIERDINKRK